VSALYLYALAAEAPRAPLGRGIFDEEIGFLDGGDLVAAVGDLGGERAIPITEAALRGQDAVVRRIAEVCDALLPARFGTLTDGDSLRREMGERREGWVEALRRVRGCEQITLRLPSEGGAPLENAGPGARYLAARRRVIPLLGPLRHALGELVRGERIDHRAQSVAVHHLIPRVGHARYREAMASDGRLRGLELAPGAPWPPYAFAGGGVA
jgi:hypothetical protein